MTRKYAGCCGFFVSLKASFTFFLLIPPSPPSHPKTARRGLSQATVLCEH